MKAAMYEEKGVVKLHDVEPVEPQEHEVQIRVYYDGICGTDLHIFKGEHDYRILKWPHVFGHEMSGIIEKIGPCVTDWKVGDKVTVIPLDPCDECPTCKNGQHYNICENLHVLGIETPGANQNLWTVKDRCLIRLPESINLKHAALVEPFAVCVHASRRGYVKEGENAVVIGAGTIGLVEALVLKEWGLNVIMSEVSKTRREKAIAMGFKCINPMEEDIVEFTRKEFGQLADVVFECSGAKSAIDSLSKLCQPCRRAVIIAQYGKEIPFLFRDNYMKEVDMIFSRNHVKKDFEIAVDIMSHPSFNPDDIITGVYKLSEVQKAVEDCLDPNGGQVKALIDCQSEL